MGQGGHPSFLVETTASHFHLIPFLITDPKGDKCPQPPEGRGDEQREIRELQGFWVMAALCHVAEEEQGYSSTRAGLSPLNSPLLSRGMPFVNRSCFKEMESFPLPCPSPSQ